MLNIENPLAPLIIGSGFIITVNPGVVLINNAPFTTASTVVNLTQSTTNYVQLNTSGQVIVNTTGFVSGNLPIAQVITNTTGIQSVIDSRPDFAMPSTSSGSTSLTFGTLGVPLTNAKVISTANSIGTASGDTDLYTVPSNKKALVIEVTYTVPTGNPSSVTCFAQFKSSGVYTKYDFVSNAGAAGTLGTTALLVPMLLLAGESFSVNCNNAGISLWPYIVEFDASVPLNVTRITSLNTGDNTILTLLNNGIQFMSNVEGVAAGSPLKGSLYYFNNTGLSRTIGWNLVPSGGSPGNSNQIGSGISVNSPGVSLRTYYGGLKTGDMISINTDANTAGQVAWVMYQYLP